MTTESDAAPSGSAQRRKRRRCEGCEAWTLTRLCTTDLPGEVVVLCDRCQERLAEDDVEQFRAAEARDAFMCWS